MATLVSDIIRDAYRESNLIAISTEPSGAQRAEGLRLLQRLLESVYGNDAGESLRPYPLGDKNIDRPYGYIDAQYDADWIVPQNARLMLNLSQAETVYLDPSPEDGARFAFLDIGQTLASTPLKVVGNGRRIEGEEEMTYSQNGQSRSFIYRGDLGTWTPVNPIVETDLWPFPVEFDDMFSISLALRLNPRNNIDTQSESMIMLRRAQNQFKARYAQTDFARAELGLIRSSRNADNYYKYDISDSRSFDIGRTNWRY